MEHANHQANFCDSCLQREVCREIFVLREILKDEATYLSNPNLRERIRKCIEALERSKFRYPFASERCLLIEEEDLDKSVRIKMQEILTEVRFINQVTS